MPFKPSPTHRPAGGQRFPSTERGFTLVEVMMAALILVVGFMGMISAITVGSEMMASAQRQTLAAQIINNELDKLRLSCTSWSSVTGLSTGAVTIDTQFRPAWSASTAYVIGNVVSYSGVWYYCTASHTNHIPPNASYWSVATSTQAGIISDTNIGCGATNWTLSRTVTNVTTNLYEVTYTVSWTKGGTSTAASTPGGSWLDQLAFYRDSPIARTYTRSNSAYFGKYGLTLSYQRS